MKIKTFNEWGSSKKHNFTDFCQEGDIVDNKIVDYFNECLPPITYKDEKIHVIQCSEPLSHNEKGQALYISFIKYLKETGIKGDKSIYNQWIFKKMININTIRAEQKARHNK